MALDLVSDQQKLCIIETFYLILLFPDVFHYICIRIGVTHFYFLKLKERYATLVSAKPEKLNTKINKNWHGSSHVIAWAALSYLLIKVFSGPALKDVVNGSATLLVLYH